MATRTTVNISLTPQLDEFLRARVKSGRYQTTSEVVREALRLLERHDKERAGSLKQLKAKLAQGAREAEHGDLLDGDQTFEALRVMIANRPAKKRTRAS